MGSRIHSITTLPVTIPAKFMTSWVTRRTYHHDSKCNKHPPYSGRPALSLPLSNYLGGTCCTQATCKTSTTYSSAVHYTTHKICKPHHDHNSISLSTKTNKIHEPLREGRDLTQRMLEGGCSRPHCCLRHYWRWYHLVAAGKPHSCRQRKQPL
jgi:hypothetical protein